MKLVHYFNKKAEDFRLGMEKGLWRKRLYFSTFLALSVLISLLLISITFQAYFPEQGRKIMEFLGV